MATSSLMRKSSSRHSRSNSSPIELHPYISQLSEHLCRLKSSEGTSSSSSSSSTATIIGHKLNDLKHLYSASVDDLLHLISAQQSLSTEQIEAASDGTLKLLDLCGIAEDVMAQAKESTGQLRLALRRRFCEHEMAKSIGMYLESRKKMNKVVAKSLKDNAVKKTTVNEKLQDASSIGQLLEESESISFEVLASLLSYIAGPRTCKKWFVGCKKEKGSVQMNKSFEAVDGALYALLNHRSTYKSGSDVKPDEMKCQLGELETIVMDLQERLGCLSRQLIKTRVALLNILNH